MGRHNSKTILLNKGFTLIELLIVVAVIALLSVLGIWAYKNQLLKARDAQRKNDMRKIQLAVEEYEKDNDCYPDEELVVCKPDNTGLQPYLQEIPCDPLTGESYEYEPEGDTCSDWYRLYGLLSYSGDADIIPSIGPEGAFNYYVSSPNAEVPISLIAPTVAPTVAPTAAPTMPGTIYFGCINHVCVELGGVPLCGPNYSWGYPVSCTGESCCRNKCTIYDDTYHECVGSDGRAPSI